MRIISENDMNIGEVIAEKRKELGLSQKEVAERAGLTYQSILNAEKGKSCTVKTIKKICSTLGLSIEIK